MFLFIKSCDNNNKEYDQEMPQSLITGQSMALRGRDNRT